MCIEVRVHLYTKEIPFYSILNNSKWYCTYCSGNPAAPDTVVAKENGKQLQLQVQATRDLKIW